MYMVFYQQLYAFNKMYFMNKCFRIVSYRNEEIFLQYFLVIMKRPQIYYMDSDTISMIKSLTTHWCVNRREVLKLKTRV